MPKRTLQAEAVTRSPTSAQVLDELEDWIKGLMPMVHGADRALVNFYLLKDRVQRGERAAEVLQRSQIALQHSQAEAEALLKIWK